MVRLEHAEILALEALEQGRERCGVMPAREQTNGGSLNTGLPIVDALRDGLVGQLVEIDGGAGFGRDLGQAEIERLHRRGLHGFDLVRLGLRLLRCLDLEQVRRALLAQRQRDDGASGKLCLWVGLVDSRSDCHAPRLHVRRLLVGSVDGEASAHEGCVEPGEERPAVPSRRITTFEDVDSGALDDGLSPRVHALPTKNASMTHARSLISSLRLSSAHPCPRAEPQEQARELVQQAPHWARVQSAGASATAAGGVEPSAA